MQPNNRTSASPFLVILAFAIVYVVWGSTYFFIQMAVKGFPPMLLGALRYTTAGLLLLGWCYLKGDRIVVKKDIFHSGISGILMLFIATGLVIWVERVLPSAMVAIMVSAGPVWLVVLDKANWRVNLKSRATLSGLAIGFIGVLLLFGEQLSMALSGAVPSSYIIGMVLLLASSIAWSGGSLYSKHRSGKGPARLNTAWQMVIAGVAFIPASLLHHEYRELQWSHIPTSSWMALAYLVLFGSLAAYSAYIWLLQVRPATQVSTHSYVNPVIAVLLGLLFAGEAISLLQITGLFVILGSVLLINLVKYRQQKPVSSEAAAPQPTVAPQPAAAPQPAPAPRPPLSPLPPAGKQARTAVACTPS